MENEVESKTCFFIVSYESAPLLEIGTQRGQTKDKGASDSWSRMKESYLGALFFASMFHEMSFVFEAEVLSDALLTQNGDRSDAIS